MPEWTSKKQAQAALKKARLALKKVRDEGYEPGDAKYEAALAECVKIDNVLRRM